MALTHVRRRTTEHSRAFTLIELLVVTAIVVVITGVVFANNNRFGGVVLLQNLTYDVALSIRQAQVYGISVARFGDATFSAGYGNDFDLSSPTTYTLFADASENGLYDCPAPGTSGCELVAATTISSGYRIQSLCATPAGGTETCSGVSSLDVLFKRPEPDAWISINGNSCILDSAQCQESARITLVSPKGDTMSVVIDANGQIAVGK
ncbi:prepilin-type N-terminal cleavage/methylation domain-containing protein [Candidatus Kaiserbacteria bacterium]|nr:prepilin-type N-terminal cleavage/methylation domain-containing protein [Candidatus Kaiserbacteria bacterium]